MWSFNRAIGSVRNRQYPSLAAASVRTTLTQADSAAFRRVFAVFLGSGFGKRSSLLIRCSDLSALPNRLNTPARQNARHHPIASATARLQQSGQPRRLL